MKTIAHEFLEIENEDFPVSDTARENLEKILTESESKVKLDSKPVTTLDSIGNLLKEQGFVYLENGLLGTALEEKQMDCRGYSVLYYSIGEKLSLPIKIISAPDHLLVRWEDSKIQINWESAKGCKVNDEVYSNYRRILEEFIANGTFFRNLNQEEIIGIAYETRGIEKARLGKHKEAIEDYDIAISKNPNYETMFNNRGVEKGKISDFQGAIDDLSRSVDIYPYKSITWLNLSTPLMRTKKYQKALEAINNALILGLKQPEIFYQRACAFFNLRNYKECIDDCDNSLRLNPGLKESYLLRSQAYLRLGDIVNSEKDLKSFLSGVPE